MAIRGNGEGSIYFNKQRKKWNACYPVYDPEVGKDKIKTKSSFAYSSPIKMIATCDDIPMHFAHGDKDDFVPSYMVYKCYDAKPGFKMIHVYENSIHARSIANHKQQYYKDIKEFLEKANII